MESISLTSLVDIVTNHKVALIPMKNAGQGHIVDKLLHGNAHSQSLKTNRLRSFANSKHRYTGTSNE